MIKIFYSYLLQSRIQQSRNPEATLRLESEIQVPLINNPEPVPRIRNPRRGVHNPKQSWVTLQIWDDEKIHSKIISSKNYILTGLYVYRINVSRNTNGEIFKSSLASV